MNEGTTAQAGQSRAGNGAETEGDLVAEAEAQLFRLGRRLGALIARLDAGELAAAGEVSATLASLDKALGAVFHERARRERSANAGAGAVAGGQLDLVAARAEIRRRLARLHELVEAERLSGKPE